MRNPKPIVLVDQDGPLADFDGAFAALCKTEGFPLDVMLPDKQTERFADAHVNCVSCRRDARSRVYSSGWFRALPLVPGAREGIELLTEHADVWICTKPLEANPTCRDEKVEWVAEHLGEDWVKRVIITPNKGMVKGAVLLDDAPVRRHIERAEWKPVVFPRPWNGEGSEWAGLPRWSWSDDVADLLKHAKGRLMTVDEAKAGGFELDHGTYPWTAYKGPRFAPAEVHLVATPGYG